MVICKKSDTKSLFTRFLSMVLIISMLLTMVACSSESNEPSNDSYVNGDGDLVVDGVEINDVFVPLTVNELVVNKATVIDLDVDEVLVNCVTVTEISVIEAEVTSLNDEFVYLAYQNFVSYYDSDIDFQKFLTDIAIGGTCVIVCVTLSTVGGPIGTFFGAVITSEFTAATVAIGAAIDAAVSGYMAYQEGGDASYILGHMLNGVADGFKWSAILAPVSGGFAGLNALKATKAIKALDAFKDLTDKEINELLKNFTKIVKRLAKESGDLSDDALRLIYKELSKELSSEITEQIFISAVRNQADITQYILKYNPFNTSSGLTRALKEDFLAKAGVDDVAAQTIIKQIQNQGIKKIDDISNAKLRKYIQDNIFDFIQRFGGSISKNFLDDCLRIKLASFAFDDDTIDAVLQIIKTGIAQKGNIYGELLSKIGRESIDVMLGDLDVLILLQTRYGVNNLNRIVAMQKLHLGLTCIEDVTDQQAITIANQLMLGDIKSFDQLKEINGIDKVVADNLQTNILASKELVCTTLKNLELAGRNEALINDIVAQEMKRYIKDDAVTKIVLNNMSKDEILDKFGDNLWRSLIENADSSIWCLSLQNKVNTGLIDDLFVDTLHNNQISEETIQKILAGLPISEWGLSDDVAEEIGTHVLVYYKNRNPVAYSAYAKEFSEIRCRTAKAYNLANNCSPDSIIFANQIADCDNRYIKEKYGDIYWNSAGYLILDDHAIAIVTIDNLTGNSTNDIKKANRKFRGIESNVPGYTWHHVEDGRTMILVPTELHAEYTHAGGASLLRKGAFD